MSTPPNAPPAKPSAHDRRRIAAVACVHPRTVDRCYQAKPVRSTIAARVLDSLLVPRFGDTPLNDLTGEMLTALDTELAADGLKASTRQKVHIVFRSVVRLAVTAGMLATVPALPRIPRVGRKMVRPFHRDDLDAILVKAAPQARLAFALAAFAGLRAGEVRGLRWSDLDLKGNTLTVRRALTRGEATTPKSGDQRVIPIAAPLRLLIDAAESSRSSPWASVAITALGKPWGESGLNQAFKRAQRRAGRSGLCFHDLRHFFVTELFRKGVGAPAVQRLAGHAELSTTQRYADMTANDLRSAIALLGNGEATSEASS